MTDTHRRASAGSGSNVANDPGSVKDGEGEKCTCGFCDGVEIEYEEDPRTGEISSFEKMSRRPRCPVCGGRNVRYRQSYTAHVAQLVQRLEQRRGPAGLSARAVPRFVTVTLDAEAAENAGIDGEESYQVWTGQGAPWTRARRAVKRRDGDAVYVGTLSARPSDGRYHLHILLITPLSPSEIREAFHVAGLDAYVQAPKDTETAETFAARKGAYAFDNAAHGPSARFVSSRGHGEGYDSEEAKARRRHAARGEKPSDSGPDPDEDSDPHARGHRRDEPRDRERGDPANGPDPAPDDGKDDPGKEGKRGRAPPIQCRGRRFDTLDAYTDAVKSLLTRRVGTFVPLEGGEVARLLAVRTARDEEPGLLRCCAHVEPEAEVRHVPWRAIQASNAPTVSTHSHTEPTDPMNPPTTDYGNSDYDPSEKGPVERFNEEANTSKVTVEMEDGRRHVTEKNHDTGEVEEYILPPLDRP